MAILVLLMLWGAGVALGTTIFWALWNWVIPAVFNGPVVTWWQALGLSLLLSIVARALRGSKS